jgi:predicted nucleic acid-binding Zn ribbon protein
MIQVAPGVRIPLRGSEETWEAIKEDFYVPSECAGCSGTVFVIQDAAYALCPECYTISPMEGVFIDPTVAGVGMGFRFEDLVRWQDEIARDRHGARNPHY